jgi:DNA-binding beta-propeller fold protein YncE
MRSMNRRAFLSCTWVAVLLALAPMDMARAAQQTLYAASVRSGMVGSGGGGEVTIAGNLYTINLASGTATLVGAIRLPGGKPIGVTGMAASPKDGTLYGITSEQSPNSPHSLVTIDPATGAATLVGDLGAAGSDIAFNEQGTLYIWLPVTSQLGTVNPSTAAVTPLGRPGPAGSPAGIAIDPQGMVFVTAKGAGGSLDNVDLTSGALQVGPPLTGAPFSTQINSMSFSPSGLLLAVNSNGGSPANTRLVTINTATGAVATIGALPDDTDALTFVGSGYGLAPTFSALNPGLRVVVVVVSTVIIGLAIWVLVRRRR